MKDEYTYEQACKVLGVSRSTLERAIARGVFTPIKKAHSIIKYLDKEQVDALKGKPLRLAKSAEKNQAPLSQYVPITSPIHVDFPNKDTLEYMNMSRIGLKMAQTPTGEVIFRPALIDENKTDMSQEGESQSVSPALAVLILLGLIVLLFIQANEKPRAKAQVETTMKQIGLEKETLATNQREAIQTLQKHPKELRELRAILDREHLLQVA